MRLGITATLLTCVFGAGVAVGALTLEPQATPTAAPAPASSTHNGGEATEGYGSGNHSGSSSTTGSSGGSAADSAGATLEISGFQFSSVRVAPGATVTVVNNDSSPHTATAKDSSFDTDTIPAGATGRFTAPTQLGSYPFFCAIHPSMTGTLIVE